ncbi:S-adenosyl-L-methionine-dependent methyltransferase [Zopfia rhizophila CBS 207.26]|uniref:S-adenosyl-L-methionine-dependent methyltransferase n=1 Tax=Zopfia rhizophila CBS 207.26 TaxID=1314779 RepID=A0A6A6E0C6_9PEZI|nr:S-adenosyl-L-methionine-dependent methyltransferase [Zopfia rhizophila CBS 207.26]
MTALTEIAEGILARAKKLDAHTASVGLLSSHFFYDALADSPDELKEERKGLVDASQDLKRLALGPVGMLLETPFTFTDLQSLRFLCYHNIPNHIPLDGDVPFSAVAKSAGVDEVLLRRFLQHAMINCVFAETKPGHAMDTAGFLVEDLAPASLKVIEAHKKWPNSSEPNEAGFNIENNTSDSFYLELAKTPERARRFGGGMRPMTRGSLQALAKAFPSLKIIVQDLPGTVEEGERLLPTELKGRVSFMGHDFFTEQPAKDANVYFFRFIPHNWSDKYSSKILKNLIPAMKDGSWWNSLERTAPDWAELFTSVDTRLQFVGTRTLKGSSISLIEAVFKA